MSDDRPLDYPYKTAGDLVDEVIARAVPNATPDDLVSVSRDFVLRALDDAHRRIERHAPWKFAEARATRSVSSGTPEIYAPPEAATILKVFNTTTGEELEYVDLRQNMRLWERMNYRDGTGRVRSYGEPRWYGMWTNIIYLAPVPRRDMQLDLYFYRHFTPLDDEDAIPTLPSPHYDLLVDFAVGEVLLHLPPSGDRYLPQSVAEPYFERFAHSLEQLEASHSAKTTLDQVLWHHFVDEVEMGEW